MFLRRLIPLSLVLRHTTQAFVAADEGESNGNFPRAMQYNERNCERSARNYQAIRAAGGDTADINGCCAVTNDDNDAAVTFWYLGTVAWVSGVSQATCV